MAAKSALTTYPGKFLWTLWALTLNAVRLPFWLIYLIPSSLRQNKNWTYRQAVGVRILKAFLGYMSVIEIKIPTPLKPGREGDAFVVIQPGKSSKYVGVVASDSQTKPETIGGTWYPKRPSSASEIGNVVLHFHGGAYVIGDGRKADAGFAAKTLIGNTSATHVFAPQYRLASNGARFPAQLQDGITSILYLHETLNIPASRILISGDSAGANLCLSLLRYIADNQEAKLPQPVCAWLWSPWVNPGDTLTPGNFSQSPHEPTDYLNESFGQWGARSITPNAASGVTLKHPNIDIQNNAFETPTPLFFSAGECEMLFHDIVKTCDAFKSISGNKVALEIEKGAVHDIILIGKVVGMEKEAAFGVKRAENFWKSCT